jgi:hypothetical protein
VKRISGHAERCGNKAYARNFCSLYARAKAFCHRHSTFDSGLRQNDCELFATVTRSRIYAPQLLPEAFGQLSQCHIARVVAEGIVHPLEVVHVKQYERDGLAHARSKVHVAL